MIVDRGSSKSVRDEVAQENENRGRRQRMESADKPSMKEED